MAAQEKIKQTKTFTVEQIRSPIGRPRDQRATLIGLGLNKCGRRRTLEDTPATRGMVEKVAHLVRIIEPPQNTSQSAMKDTLQNTPPKTEQADETK